MLRKFMIDVDSGTDCVPGKKVGFPANGKEVSCQIQNGLAVLDCKWKNNVVIEVNLRKELRRATADSKVKNVIGTFALQRGPKMHCAEWIDNLGKASNMVIPAGAHFRSVYHPCLLKGIETINAEVPAVNTKENAESIHTEKDIFTAIPCYAEPTGAMVEMVGLG